MVKQQSKLKNFTESKAWQEGHKLVLAVYRFLRSFPAEEEFSLRNQMQKASVTITTNMAEGLATDSRVDRLNFFLAANAAMIELQNCLLISRDVGFLKSAYFDEIARQTAVVNKQLSGLIAATEKMI